MSTARWMYDHFNMPSGHGKRTHADNLYKQSQLEYASYVRDRWCHHCGRLLHGNETMYCRVCAVDISEEKED